MKNIRGIGYYNILNDICRAKGSVVCQDFLKRTTIQMAKQSKKHIDIFEYPPYAYSEKQLHSIIAPGLSSFCDSFLMESPLTREWSKIKRLETDDAYGWVDYWACYRKIDFFIEVKHSNITYSTGKLTECSDYKWKTADNQLKGAKHLAKEYGKYSKGAFLLALQVFTIIDTVRNVENCGCLEDSDGLIEIQNQLSKNLNPKSNWSCLLMLNKALVLKSQYENGKTTNLFPGLILMARISKIMD